MLLDLTLPVNRLGLESLNWKKILMAYRHGRQREKSYITVFNNAVCNEKDCPIGYRNCTSTNAPGWRIGPPSEPEHCWYWGLLYSYLRQEAREKKGGA